MRQAMVALTATVVLAALVSGCGDQEEPKLTPVSFKEQVKPILDRRCAECHMPDGSGTKASGFAVNNYEAVMRGTKFGAVVIPGSAVASTLWRLVAGEVDPAIRMPHGRDPLTPDEIATLERWIDEGAANN